MRDVNIPKGWCLPNFDDVVLNVNGARKPVSLKIREGIKGEYPYYGATGQIDSLNDFTHEGEHILIGEDGANLLSKSKDLAFIVSGQFWVNNHAHAVKCMAGMPAKFIASYINSLDLSNWVSGSAQPKLTKGNLAKIPTVLPPLAEQKVIADKLDTLLTQVETTKARLERIPEILKNFRQSVLAAAVSGKLTVEWREKFKPEMVDIASISKEQFSTGLTMGNFGKKMDKSPDISGDENGKFVSHIAGWLPIRIGALCECVVPNRDKPKSFSGGYHWLLTPNFDEQSIWIDYKEIESGLSEEEVITYRAKIIKPGNVIMTCVGRVGLSAVLEESSVINQQLHAFKVNSHIKAEYLAYCVRANVEYYESKATSTTVKYLNKTACNSLPIPLPTIEEQDEIIRRVEELFAFADSIEQKTNASLQRVNKLTQSILAKAFRGELTANWRAANPELISGENSAEALLVIIKNERAKLSQTKKGRGKSVEN